MAKKKTAKRKRSSTRKSVAKTKVAPQPSGMKANTRASLIFAGIVSLILGWILWVEILNLEQVFAILLFIAGAIKVLWGIFAR